VSGVGPAQLGEALEIQYPCGCQESTDGTIVHVCAPHLRAACEREGVHVVVEVGVFPETQPDT